MSSYDSAGQLLHAARGNHHHAYVHPGHSSQNDPVNVTVGYDPTIANPILGLDLTNANLTVGRVRTNVNWSDVLHLSLLPSVFPLRPALEHARRPYGQP